MRRVSSSPSRYDGETGRLYEVSLLTRSAGSDFGPISMIHFRRPSSSQVPPQPSHASTGTLKYRPGDVAPPHPEQNILLLRMRGGHVPRPVLQRDRKSTRLNSSHSQISYAVFCLKKKTKTRSTRLR